jgi:hypothetical protein
MDEVSSAWEFFVGAIRKTMGTDSAMPDPTIDVSGCILTSMELGVKCVSWEMLEIDGEFRDLSDWICGGCVGSPRVPAGIHQAIVEGQGQTEAGRYGPHPQILAT